MLALLGGSLVLKKRTALFARVAGDNDIHAWPRAAPLARGDDRDAISRLLRGELEARKLGRQLDQFRVRAVHVDHVVTATMMRLSPRRSSLPSPLETSKHRTDWAFTQKYEPVL